MKRVTVLAALLAVVALIVSPAFHSFADDKPKHSIEEIMEKTHKGKEALVQQVIAGKADEAKLKEFLGLYESMATQKPPVGDEASWKAKTAAVISATKGLIEKKPDAAATFKTAIDCKACHTAHKPKKMK